MKSHTSKQELPAPVVSLEEEFDTWMKSIGFGDKLEETHSAGFTSCDDVLRLRKSDFFRWVTWIRLEKSRRSILRAQIRRLPQWQSAFRSAYESVGTSTSVARAMETAIYTSPVIWNRWRSKVQRAARIAQMSGRTIKGVHPNSLNHVFELFGGKENGTIIHIGFLKALKWIGAGLSSRKQQEIVSLYSVSRRPEDTPGRSLHVNYQEFVDNVDAAMDSPVFTRSSEKRRVRIVSTPSSSSSSRKDKEEDSRPLMQRLRSMLIQKGITKGQLFHCMDRNRNDLISVGEFRIGLAEVGIHLSLFDTQSLFEMIDMDKNNRVTWKEMSNALWKDSRSRREGKARTEKQRLARKMFTTPPSSKRSRKQHVVLTPMELRKRKQQIERVARLMRSAVRARRLVFGHLLETVSDLFATMDTDCSGTIDRNEFCRAMRRLDLGLTTKELREIFDGIDTDFSGRIDYNEFVQAMKRYNNPIRVLKEEKEEEEEEELEHDSLDDDDDDVITVFSEDTVVEKNDIVVLDNIKVSQPAARTISRDVEELSSRPDKESIIETLLETVEMVEEEVPCTTDVVSVENKKNSSSIEISRAAKRTTSTSHEETQQIADSETEEMADVPFLMNALTIDTSQEKNDDITKTTTTTTSQPAPRKQGLCEEQISRPDRETLVVREKKNTLPRLDQNELLQRIQKMQEENTRRIESKMLDIARDTGTQSAKEMFEKLTPKNRSTSPPPSPVRCKDGLYRPESLALAEARAELAAQNKYLESVRQDEMYECAHIRCEMIELDNRVETRWKAQAQEIVEKERIALLMQERHHEEEMANVQRLKEANMDALLRRVAQEQELIRERFEQRWDSEVADVLKRTRVQNSSELEDFAKSLREREIETLREMRTKHERDAETCRLHYEMETDVLSGTDAMSKLPFDEKRFQSERVLALLDQEDTNDEMRRLLKELEDTVKSSEQERKMLVENNVKILEFPHRRDNAGRTEESTLDVNVVALKRKEEEEEEDKNNITTSSRIILQQSMSSLNSLLGQLDANLASDTDSLDDEDHHHHHHPDEARKEKRRRNNRRRRQRKKKRKEKEDTARREAKEIARRQELEEAAACRSREIQEEMDQRRRVREEANKMRLELAEKRIQEANQAEERVEEAKREAEERMRREITELKESMIRDRKVQKSEMRNEIAELNESISRDRNIFREKEEDMVEQLRRQKEQESVKLRVLKEQAEVEISSRLQSEAAKEREILIHELDARQQAELNCLRATHAGILQELQVHDAEVLDRVKMQEQNAQLRIEMKDHERLEIAEHEIHAAQDAVKRQRRRRERIVQSEMRVREALEAKTDRLREELRRERAKSEALETQSRREHDDFVHEKMLHELDLEKSKSITDSCRDEISRVETKSQMMLEVEETKLKQEMQLLRDRVASKESMFEFAMKSQMASLQTFERESEALRQSLSHEQNECMNLQNKGKMFRVRDENIRARVDDLNARIESQREEMKSLRDQHEREVRDIMSHDERVVTKLDDSSSSSSNRTAVVNVSSPFPSSQVLDDTIRLVRNERDFVAQVAAERERLLRSEFESKIMTLESYLERSQRQDSHDVLLFEEDVVLNDDEEDVVLDENVVLDEDMNTLEPEENTWQTCYTDEGYAYYYNTLTGESRWIEPYPENMNTTQHSSNTTEDNLDKKKNEEEEEEKGVEEEQKNNEKNSAFAKQLDSLNKKTDEMCEHVKRMENVVEKVLSSSLLVEPALEEKKQRSSERQEKSNLSDNNVSQSSMRAVAGHTSETNSGSSDEEREAVLVHLAEEKLNTKKTPSNLVGIAKTHRNSLNSSYTQRQSYLLNQMRRRDEMDQILSQSFGDEDKNDDDDENDDNVKKERTIPISPIKKVEMSSFVGDATTNLVRDVETYTNAMDTSYELRHEYHLDALRRRDQISKMVRPDHKIDDNENIRNNEKAATTVSKYRQRLNESHNQRQQYHLSSLERRREVERLIERSRAMESERRGDLESFEVESSVMEPSAADTKADEKPIVSWPLLKAESMLYPELDDEHCLYRYKGLRDDAIAASSYESRLSLLLHADDDDDDQKKSSSRRNRMPREHINIDTKKNETITLSLPTHKMTTENRNISLHEDKEDENENERVSIIVSSYRSHLNESYNQRQEYHLSSLERQKEVYRLIERSRAMESTWSNKSLADSFEHDEEEEEEEEKPSVLEDSIAHTSVDEKPLKSWPLLKAETFLYPELDDEHGGLYRYEGLREDAIKASSYESRLNLLLQQSEDGPKKNLDENGNVHVTENNHSDDVGEEEKVFIDDEKTCTNSSNDHSRSLVESFRKECEDVSEEEEEEESVISGIIYRSLGVVYKSLT